MVAPGTSVLGVAVCEWTAGELNPAKEDRKPPVAPCRGPWRFTSAPLIPRGSVRATGSNPGVDLVASPTRARTDSDRRRQSAGCIHPLDGPKTRPEQLSKIRKRQKYGYCSKRDAHFHLPPFRRKSLTGRAGEKANAVAAYGYYDEQPRKSL